MSGGSVKALLYGGESEDLEEEKLRRGSDVVHT